MSPKSHRTQRRSGLEQLRELRRSAQAPGASPSPAPQRKRKPQKFLYQGPKPSAPHKAAASGAAEPDPPAEPALALDAADLALFRQAVKFVQPLKNPQNRARASGRREPQEWQRVRRMLAEGADTKQAQRRQDLPARKKIPLDPDAHEFLQDGCGPDLLRGLQKGKWLPQASLDLHGCTLDQAIERLERFLDSCLQHDIRCVHIIHGKGIGSRQGKAVLKSQIRTHLSRLAAVQAWAQCSDTQGGAGALNALLREPAKQKCLP